MGRPQSAAIDQGIVGFVAYESDFCENNCCECSAGPTTLDVWQTSARITDATQANEVVARDTAALQFHAEGAYSRTLEAGSYVICTFLGPDGRCAAIELGAGDVATVNVRTTLGPSTVVVFEPGATQPNDHALFDVTQHNRCNRSSS